MVKNYLSYTEIKEQIKLARFLYIRHLKTNHGKGFLRFSIFGSCNKPLSHRSLHVLASYKMVAALHTGIVEGKVNCEMFHYHESKAIK